MTVEAAMQKLPGHQLFLSVLLAEALAASTSDPYSQYHERLVQFVAETVGQPGCGLYTELLREAIKGTHHKGTVSPEKRNR
jgi:hypothetical protein